MTAKKLFRKRQHPQQVKILEWRKITKNDNFDCHLHHGTVFDLITGQYQEFLKG